MFKLDESREEGEDTACASEESRSRTGDLVKDVAGHGLGLVRRGLGEQVHLQHVENRQRRGKAGRKET